MTMAKTWGRMSNPTRAESTLAARSKRDAELVEKLERHYKYYKGWVFEYEYPGYFVYHRMGGGLDVWFTPDNETRGFVDISVQRDDGSQPIEGREVPYGDEFGAFELFKIVQPYLDKHAR